MHNWIVWLHVISFISWFAALFYLPRLFVYHAENRDNEGFVEVVKIQEYKLYKYIGMPAMIATLLSGSYLAYEIGLKGNGWLHVKLLLVTFLVVYFLSLGKYVNEFAHDKCTKDGKFFRMYNEIPTILMLLIVAMVVMKPF